MWKGFTCRLFPSLLDYPLLGKSKRWLSGSPSQVPQHNNSCSKYIKKTTSTSNFSGGFRFPFASRSGNSLIPRGLSTRFCGNSAIIDNRTVRQVNIFVLKRYRFWKDYSRKGRELSYLGDRVNDGVSPGRETPPVSWLLIHSTPTFRSVVRRKSRKFANVHQGL